MTQLCSRFWNERAWRMSLAMLLVLVLAAGAGTEYSSAAGAPAGAMALYLPLVRLPSDTIFGLNMTATTPERGLDTVAAAGTGWVRGSALAWRDVEPTERGGLHWDAPSVQQLERELQYASQRGLKYLLTVQGSPAWATAPYKADCAPINPANYARFGAFLAAAVARYSQAPYRALYWEIGNEPDAPLFAVNSVFGCWGDAADPFFGGRAYGAMLKSVYPAMKAIAPQITVLNGGLLLDQPYDPATNNGKMARFLEGVFLAGAGASFDMLSYHSYSFYTQTPDGSRGPVDWKVGYLRGLMQAYGVRPKPLILTETALLCDSPTPVCRVAQADAIGRYYARALNDRLAGAMWFLYDSDGFRNTALVEPGNVDVPRPAYYAYRTAAALLGNAHAIGPLPGLPAGVEGYHFRKGQQIIAVVWADVAQSATIAVSPSASVACVDRDGQPIVCDNISGAVTIAARPGPIYITEQ